MGPSNYSTKIILYASGDLSDRESYRDPCP